jgi:hypothetical protein
VRERKGTAASAGEVQRRFIAYLGEQFAKLLAESDVTDFLPLSGSTRLLADRVELRVVSATRGLVVIGTIPDIDIARRFGDIALGYVQELAGSVPLQRGRPPGITDITDDQRLCETIAGMHRDGARVTRETVAARAGYTDSAVKGYLKVTNRTFAELATGCRTAKIAE